MLTASGFANGPGTMNITTTELTLASVTFTVPAAYTRAQVLGIASIGAVNPSTTVDRSFAGRVYIDRNGTPWAWGGRWFQFCVRNNDAAVYPNVQRQLAGLTAGDTITVRLIVIGSPTWGDSIGGSTLDASVIYTR